jgi:hypothetical protein
MTTDDSHRIHLAANDPAFPAQREAAFQVISDAITAVVAPLGYHQVGSTWRRETASGRSAINLQRSRYGFDAVITLRFLLPDGSPLDHGAWVDTPEIPLIAFCDEAATDPGVIRYLDVRDDPACLDMPIAVLRDHALPWLDAHHSGHSLPINPRPVP